jgi:hypothetical protein
MDRDNGQRGGGVEPLRQSARGTTPESAALPGAARRDMSKTPTNAELNRAIGQMDEALTALKTVWVDSIQQTDADDQRTAVCFYEGMALVARCVMFLSMKVE